MTPQRKAQPELSRERIARAALDLLDREGPEGVSMRRLADELGAGTMTLYGYFGSKDELLDAAVDAAVEEIGVEVGEGSWRRQICELMEGIRAGLARHPGGVRLRLLKPMLSRGALRFTEAGLEILEGAGFDRREAMHAYQTLFFYTFGVVGFGPSGDREELRQSARAIYASLPEDRFPALSAAAEEAAEALVGEQQFHHGLELLLDGLEARLPERRPEA